MSKLSTYALSWASLVDGWIHNPSLRASKHFKAARRAYEAGQYQSCIDLIGQALDLDTPFTAEPPFSKSEAFRFRAFAYRELGNYPRALADLERVLRYRPQDACSYLDLADLHLHFQLPSKALTTLQEGIRALDTGEAAPLYLLRGRMAMEDADFQQAMDDFNFAACHLPRHAEVWWRRGLLHARRQDYRRAFADFRAAVRLAPDEVAPRYHFGRVLYRTGRFAQAREQLAVAVRLKTESPAPLSLLGRCLFQLEEYTEALPVLEKAIAAGAADELTVKALGRARQALDPAAEDEGAGTASNDNLLNAASPGQEVNSITIYERVDQPPLFPQFDDEEEYDDMERWQAAREALNAFIYTHLDYPEEARRTGVKGVVQVEFVVERNGRLTGLRAKNRLGYGCEEAAVDVFRQMINHDLFWIPGKIKGMPVRTRVRLPVRFSPALAILNSLD